MVCGYKGKWGPLNVISGIVFVVVFLNFIKLSSG